MEMSQAGRRGSKLPQLDVPLAPLPDEALLRKEVGLPEVSESEIVRYFIRLSRMNYGVDCGFYPLGSCTMKYNPKWHDDVASMPGFSNIHPLQSEETLQGALKLMFELQEFLGEITGLPGVGLAPMAGAHGEFAGMQIVRAYHLSRGDVKRKKVLIPDSAHGTNPASAAMCGFEVVTVPSDGKGNLDIEALKGALSDQVAGIMLTLPNTLGLFDQDIVTICKLLHENGALVYGDGANMNALLGQVKLGDLGFDVAHLNLHKTFSTPHGSGGPGSGPVCVRADMAQFLPSPVVSKAGGRRNNAYSLARPKQSIGPVAGFHGNFAVLIRAYAYIRSLGAEGLKEVSDNAVLNANYIRAGLKDDYNVPYDRTCMHEVILSASRQKAMGVKALEVAKRLIDYGYHPPTMYFPLIVEEALMIEPTETESKETLDGFIEVMKTINREVKESPELLKEAPRDTPVGHLDEAKAARQPDLRWRPSRGQ